MSLRPSKGCENSPPLQISCDLKQKNLQTSSLSKRVFVIRNSLLTDYMKIDHLRSLHSFCTAVFGLIFFSIILYYLADPAKFFHEIKALQRGVASIDFFIKYCIVLHLIAYFTYEGFKFWIFCRIRIHEKISDGVFLVLYLLLIISMCVGTAYIVLKMQISFLISFPSTVEQVRIIFKIHSFVRENVSSVKRLKLKENHQWQQLYPTRKHYFYYLFAPTLIYRNTYPRLERIRWKNVFRYIFEMLFIFTMGCGIALRTKYDVFKNIGIQPLTRKETALIFSLYSSCYGACLMFLGCFYFFMHCYLNFASEISRFGDREFYKDWWNWDTDAHFHRKWNIVVYDWMHAYIYTELRSMGFSKFSSRTSVIIASAIIHEYIISVSLGFFYPVLFVLFMFSQTSAGIVNIQGSGKFWNIYCWAMYCLATGVVMTCYTIEWVSRINCEKNETWIDFFIPRTLDPSCQIFDLSKT